MPTADIRTWALTPENAPAELARQLTHSLLNEGVVDVAAGSYRVLEDTGANMFVRCGSGTAGDRAVIRGDTSARQGSYLAQHQEATVQLPIAAADPSNPRIDLVVARVFDDEADSSGSSFADVEVLTGTPAGSPVPPAVPDSAIALAEVEVEANATAITNSDITDRREEAVLRDSLVPAVRSFRLATLDLTSATTFEAIPGDFGDLRIDVVARATGDTNSEFLRLRFNGLSTAAYFSQRWVLSDATTTGDTETGATSARVGQVTAALASADHFGSAEITVPAYASTSHRMLGRSVSSALPSASVTTQWRLTRFGFGFNSSSAVTSITLLLGAGGFAPGSRATLYGVDIL